MEIREAQEGEILVLEPTGRLDTTTSREFESKVQEVLNGGSLHLLVDFGSIDYVSSAGLRVLLMLGKKLPGMGGSLVLCSLSSAVLEVFEVSGFTRIFAISPNRAHGLGEAKKLQDGAKKPRRRRSRKSKSKTEAKPTAEKKPEAPSAATEKESEKEDVQAKPAAPAPPKPEPPKLEPPAPETPTAKPEADPKVEATPPQPVEAKPDTPPPPNPTPPEPAEKTRSVEDIAIEILRQSEPPPFADGDKS